MTVSVPRPVGSGAPRPGSGRGLALLLIGVGGAVGTTIRFALESNFPAVPGAWPWATFCINVTGAFILAAFLETLTVFGPDEGWLRRLRLGIGTGVLGGYTTYSTFTVEALRLGDAGEPLAALSYAVGSVVLGFLAACAGMAGVGALHRRYPGRHT